MADQESTVSNDSTPLTPPLGREALSVLIIEDDKFLRELLERKLKKEGFVTLSAIDGEEGLKILQEKKPQVLLLDLLLPGMDGFEVLAKIKSDQAVSSIPVIVLSNLGSRDDIDRASKLGSRDFLVKAHFTPQEVVDKVKKVIQETYL